MPTNRKQKKARNLRGLEILSDIENLDVILIENHFTGKRREESLDSNSARTPESATSNNLGNEEENSYLNHRHGSSGINSEYCQNSVGTSSHAETNRLSSELKSRITWEMDEVMNSVSVQIQRAINDAISNQVLPQIQNAIMASSGHMVKRGWERERNNSGSSAERRY